MTIQDIKGRIENAIKENSQHIKYIAQQIYENPEIGYREHNTSALVRSELEKLGIEYEYPCAQTGVKAKLKGRKHDYNICIIGELDAVMCEGKPAHKCGHNAQIAAMLGCAIGLAKSGVMSQLDGDVTFFAVPAEEFIDIGFRQQLKKDGKIQYFGGKQQLVAEGWFDDIDAAVMLHAQGNEPERKVYVRGHNLGFVAKTITFRGKAVHGSTPFDGVNALNAAALAILGVHSNRETFREEDRIRIHPIITKGGDVVNSVPDEVCIDTYVRGASFDAIKKGDAAVERAVYGAAQMVGAKAEIENIPGYLPIKESIGLSKVFEDVSTQILGEERIVYGEEITGSSDIGDLSCLIPTIQPSIGGFKGALHNSGFEVCDEDMAYIISSELLAYTTAELLYNNAEKAKEVKENYASQMSKAEYLKYLNQEDK